MSTGLFIECLTSTNTQTDTDPTKLLFSFILSRKLLYTYLMIVFIIGLVGRVFANGPGDLGSIPGRVKPKTLKIVLDTSLLNTW